MELQREILVFVHSIREGNFHLYVQSLRKLRKWFFVLDHFNYARWLTVRVIDLLSLPIKHPHVYQQMVKGSFSFAKSKCPFSNMAPDQVHEQNNKIIKGQGGASNFLNLENKSAQIRWETCGPEVARIVLQFEDLYEAESSQSHCSLNHHEDKEQFGANFKKDVDTVFNAMPCKPFEMTSLCALNNSHSFPPTVVDNLKQVLPSGEAQVKMFINDRLLMEKVPITGKINKNNFPILKNEPSKNSVFCFFLIVFLYTNHPLQGFRSHCIVRGYSSLLVATAEAEATTRTGLQHTHAHVHTHNPQLNPLLPPNMT